MDSGKIVRIFVFAMMFTSLMSLVVSLNPNSLLRNLLIVSVIVGTVVIVGSMLTEIIVSLLTIAGALSLFGLAYAFIGISVNGGRGWHPDLLTFAN